MLIQGGDRHDEYELHDGRYRNKVEIIGDHFRGGNEHIHIHERHSNDDGRESRVILEGDRHRHHDDEHIHARHSHDFDRDSTVVVGGNRHGEHEIIHEGDRYHDYGSIMHEHIHERRRQVDEMVDGKYGEHVNIINGDGHERHVHVQDYNHDRQHDREHDHDHYRRRNENVVIVKGDGHHHEAITQINGHHRDVSENLQRNLSLADMYRLPWSTEMCIEWDNRIVTATPM